MFGIVSTQYTPSRGYFQVVERRGAGTLLPLIQRCILPGTEVYTDDWAAYRRVNTLPNVAAHRVEVHARHFVDPCTGVHTQEAESSWSSRKLAQKRRKGLRKEDLQVYLECGANGEEVAKMSLCVTSLRSYNYNFQRVLQSRNPKPSCMCRFY